MRTIFITLLTVALVLTLISKVALPSLNANGKAVKDRAQQYYEKTISN